MIDLIEGIGPVLGIVAFLGLAILAFLIFQQAREVRRLREWAGRAPERAAEAAEASLAAAEARGEDVERPEEARPGRLAGLREWAVATLGPRWRALDRNSPVDPRYLVALLAAAVVATGLLTGGFGLLGGEESRGGGGGGGGGGERQGQQRDGGRAPVAVLNATQSETDAGVPIQAVPELASRVANEVVAPAGFRVRRAANAASGFEQTAIMYEPGNEGAAAELARAVRPQLGETETTPMIQEVRDLAGGAPLAVVVGQDDAEF